MPRTVHLTNLQSTQCPQVVRRNVKKATKCLDFQPSATVVSVHCSLPLVTKKNAGVSWCAHTSIYQKRWREEKVCNCCRRHQVCFQADETCAENAREVQGGQNINQTQLQAYCPSSVIPTYKCGKQNKAKFSCPRRTFSSLSPTWPWGVSFCYGLTSLRLSVYRTFYASKIVSVYMATI